MALLVVSSLNTHAYDIHSQPKQEKPEPDRILVFKRKSRHESRYNNADQTSVEHLIFLFQKHHKKI
jgi:hypothetical protein